MRATEPEPRVTLGGLALRVGRLERVIEAWCERVEADHRLAEEAAADVQDLVDRLREMSRELADVRIVAEEAQTQADAAHGAADEAMAAAGTRNW